MILALCQATNDLIINEHGNYVIQKIISFNNEHFISIIFNIITSNSDTFKKLCIHKYSSSFIEKVSKLILLIFS